MDHVESHNARRIPPLRNFLVKLKDSQLEHIIVTAHLAFNNKERGEGLIFRRYFDDDVRTYVVAEFEQGTFEFYTESIDPDAVINIVQMRQNDGKGQ